MTIEDLQERYPDDQLSLITDSQVVEDTLKLLGFGERTIQAYQGLFIRQHNGEITRCYAFTGNIPYLWKQVTRLELKF